MRSFKYAAPLFSDFLASESPIHDSRLTIHVFHKVLQIPFKRFHGLQPFGLSYISQTHILYMKKFLMGFFSLILSIGLFAQSKYDHKEAFNPQFYPYPGSNFRSASGEPGPKYWQNRADYKI